MAAARGWLGARIPARLRTWPTGSELARMARHPAAFAPTAAEVLTPGLPCPTPSSLDELGARDVGPRGGPVTSLSLAGRTFVAFPDALFRLAPQLQEVRFVGVRHILDEFVRCPAVGRLRKIDLTGNRIGAAGAALLATCEHFADLRVLDLTRNGLTDADLPALGAAPWADSLRELRLVGNALTAAGIRAAERRFGNRLLLT